MVAHLVGIDVQNVAGFLEPGKSRTKHDSDSPRSRLALEMDRIAPDRVRNLHVVLCQKIPAAVSNGGAAAHFVSTRQTREGARFPSFLKMRWNICGTRCSRGAQPPRENSTPRQSGAAATALRLSSVLALLVALMLSGCIFGGPKHAR